MQHIATPGQVLVRTIPPRRRSTAFHDELRYSLARYSKQALTPGHDVAATSIDKHSSLLADLKAPIVTNELHEAMQRQRNNTRCGQGE